eukprot:7694569-Prorocentrum_lima.AAC.1
MEMNAAPGPGLSSPMPLNGASRRISPKLRIRLYVLPNALAGAMPACFTTCQVMRYALPALRFVPFKMPTPS